MNALLFLLATCAALEITDNTPRAYHVRIERDISELVLCAHATARELYACDTEGALHKVLYRAPAAHIKSEPLIHTRQDEIRIPKTTIDSFLPMTAAGALVELTYEDGARQKLWIPRARAREPEVEVAARARAWMPWQYALLVVVGGCAAAALGAVLLLTRPSARALPSETLSGYDFEAHRDVSVVAGYKKLAIKLGLHYE